MKIGTIHQNPVILNRNDMKGPSAKQWKSATGMGYWDVDVATNGKYTVQVRFFEPVKVPGKTTIRFGPCREQLSRIRIRGILSFLKT